MNNNTRELDLNTEADLELKAKYYKKLLDKIAEFWIVEKKDYFLVYRRYLIFHNTTHMTELFRTRNEALEKLILWAKNTAKANNLEKK